MKRGMAVAGLIVVTAIWGGGFVASDIALNSLTPMQIMAIRFLLGAVLMSFIRRTRVPEHQSQEIGAGVLMGIALFAASRCRLSACNTPRRPRTHFSPH